MAKIKIDNLIKYYSSKNGDSLQVINNFSLEINNGEFITFFGPNGCGKTTLLNLISGITPIENGQILIDSKTPTKARTGMIFQNYEESLMPWLSCEDNILFPFSLKIRKFEREQGKERLNNLLKELNLELPLKNYPYQLSGGQQQLVSILRTLIYNPDVILMDEPFSALDYQTRSFMQLILLDIWHKEKTTILFVSHDIEEAIFLADRLILLNSLPTSVKEIVTIPFKRPREKTIFELDDFYHLKTKCLRTIERVN